MGRCFRGAKDDTEKSLDRPSKTRQRLIDLILLFSAFCVALLTGCGQGEPSVEERLLQRQRERQAAELAKPQTFEEKLQTAQRQFERKNYLAAQQITQKLLVGRPDDYSVVILAARSVAGLGDKSAAMELLDVIPDGHDPLGPVALREAANWLADDGDYDEAINRLLRLRETGNATRRDLHELASLLNNAGRRMEAAKVLGVLLEAGDVTEKELFSLITLGGPFIDATRPKPTVGKSLSPAALALARVLREDDANRALSLTRRLHDAHPQSSQIFAFLARLSAEVQDWDGLMNLLTDRPDDVQEEPEYWFALGLMFQQRGDHRGAVRSFIEAVTLDPTDRFSFLHLARSLRLLGRVELSDEMMRRHQLLDESSRLIRKIGNAPGTDDQLNRLAEILDAMHRPLEAMEWRLIAVRQRGAIESEIQSLQDRRETIQKQSVNGSHQPLLAAIRIADWPLPDLNLLAEDSVPASPAEAGGRSEIRMPDVAEAVGLEFQYVNRSPPSEQPFLIYHLNGGGMGVLDFDLDGWPDCYFSQSGGPPMNADGSLPNQLFRNLAGKEFASVTEPSATGDRGFGQGLSVADLNQDGFPDLLVANIGRSVWYQNQGDGSFVRRSLIDTTDADAWTTSIACGDLSGDGLPEIALINYSDDEDAYRLPCQVGGDYCSPQRFRAAADRVLTVNADGTLADWENGLPTDQSLGHGFGAIIANIDQQNGNELFVVNDTDSNHYWIRVDPSAETEVIDEVKTSKPMMRESAPLFGLARGILGNRQGCMGLAQGDFDRNGRMDFYVTNYWEQPSDLYMQQPGAFFQNATMKQGLGTPSVKRVGWGTQATDLDRDGWLDLAVLNGHVVDHRHPLTPYKMTPQLFRGGPTRFESLENLAEAYWSRPALGRALATVDWNRDGKTDLLANHLDAPVALLENRTDTQNWIQFDLAGVTSGRDAVGAEIRVEAGGQTWTSWVVGGDGFLCSNEATVDFGIGRNEAAVAVEIQWPSGARQRLTDLKANQRYLVVESQARPFLRSL